MTVPFVSGVQPHGSAKAFLKAMKVGKNESNKHSEVVFVKFL